MHLARMCRSQLRLGPMGGVLGFEYPAVFQMADALGYDHYAVAQLIGDCERGIVKGFSDAS